MLLRKVVTRGKLSLQVTVSHFEQNVTLRGDHKRRIITLQIMISILKRREVPFGHKLSLQMTSKCHFQVEAAYN